MKVVFVCDIGEDIDDMIAVEYLHLAGRLDYVVLDRPEEKLNYNDLNRIKKLKELGVQFKDAILPNTKAVFCGGAFTKVAQYVENNELDLFVANGGFAGDNLVENPLPKFKGRNEAPTFNLNMDISSAKKVFDSKNIKRIRLVTKNVCHSRINMRGQIHKDEFLQKYILRLGKRLHDLLMVKEGLSLIDEINCNNEKEKIQSMCYYTNVEPYTVSGRFTQWGSHKKESSNIEITIGWK